MPFDTAIPTFGKGGKGVFPQESYNSRKPIKSLQETQKSWVYRGARNPKENVFDKYSIYNHKNNPYKWDSHGNVSTATTQTNFEIGFREEKKYVRKAFGRTTPHVTGSAHPTQDRIYHYRPKTRQKSALTEQVNWYHQGIHGKTFLTTRKYPYLLRSFKCPHQYGTLGQYCEVLGPKCCTACIEVCNRKMVEEYHKEIFPYIDMTASSLVAPFLAEKLLPKLYCNCNVCTKYSSTEMPFETDPIKILKSIPRLRKTQITNGKKSRLSEVTGLSGRSTRNTMTVIME
ncbi:uncharacterized protein [Ptychodera flava]|uniref:uncharacterized protein isoform X1 n=1 Tax=Ptychodera flava TaxID=63121 RepID=UPI00396AAA35